MTSSDSSAVVLGIDLGTTKVKVIAFDPHLGRVTASAETEYLTAVTADGVASKTQKTGGPLCPRPAGNFSKKLGRRA